jgi:uncharacterized cupredoxin-like copper-binding protein
VIVSKPEGESSPLRKTVNIILSQIQWLKAILVVIMNTIQSWFQEEDMKSIRISSILLTVLILSITACARATPQPFTATIEMTEYKFNPSSLELKVGQQVTLNLVNNGQLQHELMLGREVLKVNNRPSGYQEDLFEAGGVEPTVTIIEEGQMTEEEEEEEHAGFVAILGAGGQGTLTFSVTEDMVGEWEMGCFEQDGVHYDAGMHGPVTITR